MKLGLLTFQDTNNFGSLLQTFALYKILSEHSDGCEVLNYRCLELYKREIPKPFYKLRTVRDLYRYIKYYKMQVHKYKNLCQFSEKYMKSTPVLENNKIKDYAKKYNKLVVGSDIVWGLDITGDDYAYFLDFSEGQETYAYASSFGSDYILRDDRKDRVGRLLKDFKLLSVREKDACRIIEELCGRKAELVLDPTLLLTEKDWKPFISGKVIQQPYLLTYFEDEKGVVKKNAKELAGQYGLPVYNITNGMKMEGVNNISVYTLEDFLSLIYYAEYVVTASYHGMAFSINFNKQFNFFNRCHKSRMETLAAICGLENRELLEQCKADVSTIDYKKVNEQLELWREKSLNFIDKVCCDE